MELPYTEGGSNFQIIQAVKQKPSTRYGLPIFDIFFGD